MKYILGTKEEMTQLFRDDGKVEPVTLVRAEPVSVFLLRTLEKDGYAAVQVAQGKTHREYRVRTAKDTLPAVGDSLAVSQFAGGDKVTVTATSKGHGFQGGMKRHGFHGAPKTHGVKHAHRQPGSIGAGGVQKVLKGQRMAGRMGGDRVTFRTKIVQVFSDTNMIAIKGSVPGNRGTLVEIRG